MITFAIINEKYDIEEAKSNAFVYACVRGVIN